MTMKLKAVFAYGVTPIYPPQYGNGFSGISVKPCGPGERSTPGCDGVAYRIEPSGYLHYWVDNELRYREEIKPTPETPDLGFIIRNGVKVVLNGPSDYTISQGPFVRGEP